MNKKCGNSELVYGIFNFNKSSFTYKEFNELSTDRKNKHLQKFFNKINELRKIKSITVNIKKEKLL